MASAGRKVVLDGCSLTTRALSQLGYPGSTIAISAEAMTNVRAEQKRSNPFELK